MLIVAVFRCCASIQHLIPSPVALPFRVILKIEMATRQQPIIGFLFLDSSSSHEEDSPNNRRKKDSGLSGENIWGTVPISLIS